MTHDIKALQSIIAPTKNPVTDGFGIFRHWGIDTWHPDRKYSPVHAGIDFSALPEDRIAMPVKGEVWGERSRNPSIGSYCMILPERSAEVALYFYHCEPTGDRWRSFDRGEDVTVHAGHGIGAPHLHFEVNVTDEIGRQLLSDGILRPINNLAVDVWGRARDAGISPADTLRRVRRQMESWGILEIGENYMIRQWLPEERRSRKSNIGKGPTWVIDPRVFMEV